jgi:hypothetical protein
MIIRVGKRKIKKILFKKAWLLFLPHLL